MESGGFGSSISSRAMASQTKRGMDAGLQDCGVRKGFSGQQENKG